MSTDSTKSFVVRDGVELFPEDIFIFGSTADPEATSVVGGPGSILLRNNSNAGELWIKKGSADNDWIRIYHSAIWDDDDDTGIQVEKGADDDTIRFDINGTVDHVIINASGIITSTYIGGTGVGDDISFVTTTNASKGSYIFQELTTDGPVYTSGGNGTLNTEATLAVSRGGTGLATFGGTNTVLYTTAADTIASSANFTWDGTNLNITNSGTPILRLIDSSDAADAVIRLGQATNYYVQLGYEDTDDVVKLVYDTGSFSSSTNGLSINSSGQVGIGTIGQAAPLEIVTASADSVQEGLRITNVNAGTSAGSSITFYQGGSDNERGRIESVYNSGDSVQDLIFYAGTAGSVSALMTIEGVGNVLVNTTDTTTPNGLVGMLKLGGTLPGLVLYDSNGGVDAKHLYIADSGAVLLIGSSTDDGSTNDEYIRINASGNMGFNTSDVEAWHSDYRVIEWAAGSLMVHNTVGNSFHINNSAYFDGAWKHKALNESASNVYFSDGSINFRTDSSTSHAADSAVSWISALTIAADGGISMIDLATDAAGAATDQVVVANDTTGALKAITDGANGEVLSLNASTGIVEWSAAGSGTVTSSGTPLDGEIAVFTTATDIEGDANLTWSGAFLAVNSGTGNTVATFTSTDDTCVISLNDNDTNNYFVSKDSTLSIGQTAALSENNLNIGVNSISIGSTTVGTNHLRLNATMNTTTGTNRSFYQTLTVSPASGTSGQYAQQINFTSSGTYSFARGYNFTATFSAGVVGTVQCNNVQNVYTGGSITTNRQYSSLGTLQGTAITTFTHFYGATTLTSGSIGTLYGLHVNDTATGTPTTAYGAYIGDMGATTSWAFYNSAAGDSNYFAGHIGVGTTDIDAPLHVNDNTYTAATGIHSKTVLLVTDTDTANSAFISIVSDESQQAGLYFGDHANADEALILYNNSNQQFQFGVADGTTDMILDSNADLTLSTGELLEGSIHSVSWSFPGLLPSTTTTMHHVILPFDCVGVHAYGSVLIAAGSAKTVTVEVFADTLGNAFASEGAAKDSFTAIAGTTTKSFSDSAFAYDAAKSTEIRLKISQTTGGAAEDLSVTLIFRKDGSYA